jgi:hypothetical protein
VTTDQNEVAVLSERERAARAGIRALLSILIGAMFIVVLMVSSEQQSAMTELRAKNPNLSYIRALRLAEKPELTESVKRDVLRVREEIVQDQKSLSKEKKNLTSLLRSATPKIVSISKSIQGCSLPNYDIGDFESLPVVWNEVADCVSRDTSSDQVRDRFRKLEEVPDSNIENLVTRLSQVEEDILDLKSRLELNSKSLTEAEIGIADQKLASSSFVSVIEIRKFWPVRILGLVDLTPNVLSITLSFVSGLFGALLLTLILAVYPQNSFNFVTSNSYFDRIFLGGLISITVYVVIGGGMGVLGASAVVRDGTNNFLTFCAIGILAGMFSDRVAGWLSEQAKVFKASATPAPAPPVPPAT